MLRKVCACIVCVCVACVCAPVVCVCVKEREKREREPPGLLKDVEELVCVCMCDPPGASDRLSSCGISLCTPLNTFPLDMMT